MTNAVFDTEKQFDSFVKEYGGVVVKETISKNPIFNNADYLFPAQQIVAELKCLQKDKLNDPEFIAKLKACWAKWHCAGKLPEAFSMEIHKEQMPPECYSDFRKIFLGQLRGIIKKANKQIRETKNNLHVNDYKGLLLLANDGDFSLSPPTMIRSIFEILNGDYSHINDFVVFTTNIKSKVPGLDIPSYVWISGCFSEETAIPKAVIEDLGGKWKSFYESITGIPLRSSGSFETQRIVL